MDSVFFTLEIIGTIAFAVSGAMIAMHKGMDIFGVVILGITTAVGGGIIRDIILGITPPATFVNPIYALVATGTSIIVFLPFIQKLIVKSRKAYEILLLITDSAGLGVFSVMGVKTAYAHSTECSLFLVIFVGVITGVGGGIIRDLFAGITPFIFVKHFYACASLIGTTVCAILWKYVGNFASMVVGVSIIIVLRILAARFHWRLPKPHLYDE